MSFNIKNFILKLKKAFTLIIVLIGLGLVAVFLANQDGKMEHKNKAAGYNPDSIPMMDTDSVTMLISDSGIVRYKFITRTWQMFDSPREPYWLFPDKFYMERFDTSFIAIATIKADSVWNYTRKKLWKLKGHVEIKNIEGEIFTSEELFWDQKTKKVYSKELVEIDRPGKIKLRGRRGFESNEQMTDYSFSGVYDTDIYVNENTQNVDTTRNSSKN